VGKEKEINIEIDHPMIEKENFLFIKNLGDTISQIGKKSFYPSLFNFIGHYLDCSRWLLMRYRRFSKPEFLYNRSLSIENQECYLNGLYRLDPLLRVVTNGKPPPVLTFQNICHQYEGDDAYHELFRSCLVRDELVVMLPDMGGAYLALCFDRQRHDFTEEEIRQIQRLLPIISPLHRHHIEHSLARDVEMIQGSSTVRMAVMDANGYIVHKSRNWHFPEQEEVDRIMREMSCERLSAPARIGEYILHWESLSSDHTLAPKGRVFLCEKHSPGYVNGGIENALTNYARANNLSPRECEVVKLIMRGYPTIGISEKLNLTVGTVKSYKHRLYEKLDITSEREIFTQFIHYVFLKEKRD